MFWSRFYDLCKENNLKPNPVAALLGISSGTLTFWKNGKLPSAENLLTLSKYFNASTDYLLGISDVRYLNDDIGLTQKEAEIISAYRCLSVGDQKLIQKLLDVFDFPPED